MVSGNAQGAIVSVVASIVSNLGTNIQKEAHLRKDNLPDEERRTYLKSPLWWIGLVGVVSGAIGDFVAFAMASQELVVAVGCAAVLICNVIVSMVWHKEKFGWTDLVGIAFVLAGAIIFALAAPISEDYTAQQLADNFQRVSFLVVLVIQALCMVLLLSTISSSRVYKLRMRCQYRCFRDIFERYTEMEQQLWAVVARLERIEEQMAVADLAAESVVDTAPVVASTLSDIISESDRVGSQYLDPFAYAACSGTAGGLMALFAGCSSKALKQTLDGDNQFSSHWTYLFLLGLVVFILVQTHFLNKAMMLGDLMSVIPTFQAFWIVFGVVSGMAFYGHSEGMSYPGLFLMIAGLLFLFQHPRIVAGEDVFDVETTVEKCCGTRVPQQNMSSADSLSAEHGEPAPESTPSLLKMKSAPNSVLT